MKGRFRKRANTVFCPNPKRKLLHDQFTEEQSREWLRLMKAWSVDNEESREQLRVLEDTLPQRMKKFTGWQCLDECESCEFIEEYHIENQGVFCTWPITASEVEYNEDE